MFLSILGRVNMHQVSVGIWAPFQYPIRRLTVRSRKVSKPPDLYLELSDRSVIWQAPRQQGCRSACQISKRCDNLNYQSRGFETSRDLTIRRLIGYWNGALIFHQLYGCLDIIVTAGYWIAVQSYDICVSLWNTVARDNRAGDSRDT